MKSFLSLKECKDLMAFKRGHSDWQQLVDHFSNTNSYSQIEEIAHEARMCYDSQTIPDEIYNMMKWSDIGDHVLDDGILIMHKLDVENLVREVLWWQEHRLKIDWSKLEIEFKNSFDQKNYKANLWAIVKWFGEKTYYSICDWWKVEREFREIYNLDAHESQSIILKWFKERIFRTNPRPYP